VSRCRAAAVLSDRASTNRVRAYPFAKTVTTRPSFVSSWISSGAPSSSEFDVLRKKRHLRVPGGRR
jgi:hypothetical protein